MRFLAYLLTLFLVGTAVAQNPTILQGNYITNVFGNSNFVLNPNAQTNVLNVTVSSATVTRSTTTPLVATSEFNITTSTSTGYADWSTRTFDAGIKNQNCEARFTYRGFSVGSTTAQILQGANVVAQLTLTASTDPRIASINFPCGDLSSATTFRLQQATASLTGTNEIGGIYVGLATNMANVAQAEYIGYGGYANGGAITYWDTSTIESYMAVNSVGAGGTETSSSSIIPEPISIGNLLRVRFNNLKPGNYHATFTGPLHKDNSGVTGNCSYSIYPVTVSGSTPLGNDGEVFTYNLNTVGQDPNPAGGTLVSNFTLTSTQDVYLYIKVGSASTVCRASVGVTTGKRIRFHLHRFPSSSELVVKPETQNVWGGVRYYGTGSSSGVRGGNAASTTYATFNSATWTANRTLQGKCAAPTSSGDDVGCSIQNLPVGAYKVQVQGLLYPVVGSSAALTACSFEIYETTTATSIHNGTMLRSQTDGGIIYETTSLAGIFSNTALATRNFVIRGAKTTDTSTGNAGTCNVFYSNSASDLSAFQIIVTPLDQPSNSALYVQGPVLGAQTGAAISAGYVGEVKYSVGTATSLPATYGTSILTTISVTPGVWLVQTHCKGRVVAPTLVEACVDDSGSCLDSNGENTNASISSPSNTSDIMDSLSSTAYHRITGTKTLGAYCGRRFTTTGGVVDGYIKAVRIN